jgi:hypothetical protein
LVDITTFHDNIDIGSVGIAGSGTTSSTGAIEVTGSGYGKMID